MRGEGKNYAVSLQRWRNNLENAAINAHLHEDKTGIGRLWEWDDLSVLYDLSWKVQFITPHWLLGDPTDPWKRRGVVPGHEGKGTLGRLLELGVDWTGPASHSCLVCEDPAAFAIIERERQTKKIRLLENRTKHLQQQSKGNLSSARLGERSEEDRYINKGAMSPILAECVITNICKLIRDTKSLFKGFRAQEELTPLG